MATLSYDELIARLVLQANNIGTYKSQVQSTPDEEADIVADLANLEQAGENAEVIDGNKKTAFQIKQSVFDGDPSEDIPVYPTTPAFTLPNPAAKPGAYQRFVDRGKRWKTAAGWTPEIGTALGYDGPAAKPVPGTVKPTIQAFPAAHGAHFSLVVSGRGEATMWDVYIIRKGGSPTKLTSGEGKSADIYVTLSSPGDAEQIQVYVQLRKSNADYGQPSEPVFVTLNP